MKQEIISYPASAAGTMTRVLEAGSGSEVVIFIHGAGARADRWSRNLSEFARAGYRCFALDLPGHGFAQKGAGFQYGVPAYASFVRTFLEEHEVEAAHFVGTSLGAHILATVFCERPSLARSMVLVGATGLFPIGENAREKIAHRILDRSREGIRDKLRSVLFDQDLITSAMVEEEFQINNSPGASEAFTLLSRYFRERLDDDVIGDRLVALGPGHPRLLVWGEEDRSVPLSLGHAAQAKLGARLVSIPEAAHAPYWEAAEHFNGEVLRFLRDNAVSEFNQRGA